MAEFNQNIPIGYQSSLRPRTAKRTTVMKDHSFVIQKDSSSVVYTGVIVCVHVTPAFKTEIETFYSTNEDISWSFVNPHDGATYTLYHTDIPSFEREQREATELYVCYMPVIGTK